MSTHHTLAVRELARTADDLASRFGPSGNPEHKFVTVLFADLNGSTALSTAIEPEEWWSVITSLFEVMCAVVDEFGGWVGNFTGDGVNAVFEASDGTDGHARRACEAAYELRRTINAATPTVIDGQLLDLEIRIGINSGRVMAGTIGRRYSSYYTAIGYAVCLAKRMEALATPDRILLT